MRRPAYASPRASRSTSARWKRVWPRFFSGPSFGSGVMMPALIQLYRVARLMPSVSNVSLMLMVSRFSSTLMTLWTKVYNFDNARGHAVQYRQYWIV